MRANKFEQIHAFVTVVEQMSFTGAADKLDMAKSSLSRRVSELEQRLGVQLLQRTTRKLSLTDQGQQFYQRSVQILAELEEVEQIISDEQVELKGRIRMAAPLSFSILHLSSVVSEFKSLYPNIDLNIDLNDRQIDLVEEGFDLAVRAGNLQDSNLLVRKLGIVRMATCASPEYLKRYGAPEHPSQLSDHLGLYYTNVPANLGWRYLVDARLQSFMPKNYLSANNGDFLVRSAVNGLGLVNSPTFISYRLLQSGDLVRVLADFPSPESGLYAVFPPGRLMPARVRALVDFLQNRFGDHPYWDKLS
jgi:DNA-binding transcriptional LysR family regulator